MIFPIIIYTLFLRQRDFAFHKGPGSTPHNFTLLVIQNRIRYKQIAGIEFQFTNGFYYSSAYWSQQLDVEGNGINKGIPHNGIHSEKRGIIKHLKIHRAMNGADRMEKFRFYIQTQLCPLLRYVYGNAFVDIVVNRSG